MNRKIVAVATTVAFGGTLMAMPNDWDKTFRKSEKVVHEKVTFVNRFGISLVADCYKPKGESGKLAAVAVSGPFGAVKEQASGLYAQTLAGNASLNSGV